MDSMERRFFWCFHLPGGNSQRHTRPGRGTTFLRDVFEDFVLRVFFESVFGQPVDGWMLSVASMSSFSFTLAQEKLMEMSVICTFPLFVIWSGSIPCFSLSPEPVFQRANISVVLFPQTLTHTPALLKPLHLIVCLIWSEHFFFFYLLC